MNELKYLLFYIMLLSFFSGNAQQKSPVAAKTDPVGQATWWKEAVVYQIYPRSFKDSDGYSI